eukprot:TRINITY_DN11563_c0_g1_i1.p1 TRINITY_DN11563_c0_g1~~TRINITY_DN11563_c0_g1_i1.p1  ORF type:complete len:458 (+),score=180.60 TRINITY_DN11563_c0_g1_i1:176-1549(+)
MLGLEGDGMYTTLLVALTIFFLLTKLSQPRDDVSVASNVEFQNFQSQFVVVFLIMMMADWLQGPTVYKLYEHYGFTRQENAVLFVAGFGSSMVFGAFAGTLADKYGRKLCCQVYGVTYGLCCVTKHFNDFRVLMLGRILGGFSTSILWSAFESWMISEHNKRGFDSNMMGGTFSMMIQRNGIIAIVSGFLAQAAVTLYGGHPVAPFDLSLTCLVIGTLIITATWSENYGNTQATQTQGLARACSAIVNDRKIQLIGLMQSLFEGAMYTFVFGWTPRLEAVGQADTGEKVHLPFGFVFASFMISCSIGATVFNHLSKSGRPEDFMMYVFLAAGLCMAGSVIATSSLVTMLCFCGFEVCVGIFWPSIMSLRSQYLPEEGRATVMNIFRIPLNALVCLVLFNQNTLSESDNFKLCALAHVICALLAKYLSQLSPVKPPKRHPMCAGDDTLDCADMMDETA